MQWLLGYFSIKGLNNHEFSAKMLPGLSVSAWPLGFIFLLPCFGRPTFGSSRGMAMLCVAMVLLVAIVIPGIISYRNS
jgi:cytochrome c oxidase assembly factor CtaG